MNNEINNHTQMAKPQDLIPDLCQVKSVFWLILFSEALVIIMILLSSGGLEFSWSHFATLSFYVEWVVLVTAACLCRIRLHVEKLSLEQLMIISYTVILGVNFIISLVAQWGMNRFIVEELTWEWIIRNQIVGALIGALLLHYFYGQLQSRLRAKSELQARVQALQSRIRPHFLFNSMNIIASLIHEAPDSAERAVEDLSELFRASLKEAGAEVTLSQEITLCKKYTNIEQLRLGDRLSVEWDIDAPDDTPIPLLSVQPLIENAIYHGIQPSAIGGIVTISIARSPKGMTIRVSNPVPSIVHGERYEKGNQMALENIRHRLQALYGDEVSMTSHTENNEYKTEIYYPII